tara:strand:- start:850 stop:1608 length:759 start_codon:yes stop_codon:yes gene_type:complete
MSVLFLMVARSGSKGVPNKNMRRIGGLTLIGWKAHPILQYFKISDTANNDVMAISTDSEEYKTEARSWGFDAPFTRPEHLSTDTAATSDVIIHALDWYEKEQSKYFDSVCLLEPSTPFLNLRLLCEIFRKSVDERADLVVAMREVSINPIFVGDVPSDSFVTPIIVKMEAYGKNHHLRRQDLKPQWTMSGACYLVSVKTLRTTGNIYGGARNFGVMFDRWHSIDIDEPRDLDLAEMAVKNSFVGKPEFLQKL